MRRWAILVSVAGLLLQAARAVDLPACKNQKIYILDLNGFVSGDVPPCYLEDIAVVNPSNGVVYTPEVKLKERVSHRYGSHAGPWYVMEAIKKSGLLTYNIEEADVVFVDSYCYYMWWLGWTHSRGRTQDNSPGDYLMAAFKGMVASSRWKRHDGKDYVFYDPHPGFASEAAGKQYLSYVCNTFLKSMHIVAERGQRNLCPSYWDMADRVYVAPHVANTGSGGQYQAWEAALKPAAERKNLLFAKFRCTPFRVDRTGNVINVGKKMRHDMAKALEASGEDVLVKCTDAEYGGETASFNELLAEMQDSKYCLLLPGDSASSRALSEMMMAGCIPVYAGPPYATMPMHEDVDYTSLGVYFNVSEYHSWQTQTMHWELHPTERPAHSLIPWFWVAEKEVYPQLLSVATASDIVPQLRRVAKESLDTMSQAMETGRQAFVFYDHLTPQRTAVSNIISRMCSLAGGLEKPLEVVEAAKLLAATDAVQASKLQQERQKRARRAHVTGGGTHMLRGESVMRFPE